MFLYGALPRQEQFFIWKNEKHSCEHGSLSTVRTGITEPHRSEKTFKIIEFNHCTSTPNHVPTCHISTSFQYLQGLYQGFDQTNISANTACQHCREEGDVSPVRHNSSLQKNARAQLCTVTFHSLPCLHISLLRELWTHQVNQSDKNLWNPKQCWILEWQHDCIWVLIKGKGSLKPQAMKWSRECD